MATDNSPPRIRLILIMAFGTVGTLFVLKFVFDSYFTDMWEGEAKAKMAPALELAKLHEEETKKLTGSPIPIDKAISELSSKGRESSALIAPQPSTDDGPLVGWKEGQRALQAKAAETNAAHEPAVAGGDASTTTTTGAAATKGDAGVNAPPPAAGGAKDAGAAAPPAAAHDGGH